MEQVVLELRAGDGLLPSKHRPIHRLMKPVAVVDYRREPGLIDRPLLFRRSGERSAPSGRCASTVRF